MAFIQESSLPNSPSSFEYNISVVEACSRLVYRITEFIQKNFKLSLSKILCCNNIQLYTSCFKKVLVIPRFLKTLDKTWDAWIAKSNDSFHLVKSILKAVYLGLILLKIFMEIKLLIIPSSLVTLGTWIFHGSSIFYVLMDLDPYFFDEVALSKKDKGAYSTWRFWNKCCKAIMVLLSFLIRIGNAQRWGWNFDFMKKIYKIVNTMQAGCTLAKFSSQI